MHDLPNTDINGNIDQVKTSYQRVNVEQAEEHGDYRDKHDAMGKTGETCDITYDVRT